MSTTSSAKRLIYLIHRWTGVGACLLMALWFVSGVVMLFIGYPKLTPWERLGAMRPLNSASCCVPVSQALQVAGLPVASSHDDDAGVADAAHGHGHAAMSEVTLTSVRGKPYYRIRQGHSAYVMVDAIDGKLAPAIDESRAQQAASSFLHGAHGQVVEKIDEDRWTHSRGLNAHRPLYAVQMDDAGGTLLYVSSVTGEVIMDAPRAQRLWNYTGAWLHWLYMVRDRPSDPVWNWTVIFLSAVGTITAITGTLAGIWRWRFSGRYKSGSHSPYREGYLRWHHIFGLLFAGIMFSWIFSGLMSMNPLGIFNAKGARPDAAAYHGGDTLKTQLDITVPAALALLERDGFAAVELEWHLLAGRPYLLAHDAHAATRMVVRQDGRYLVRRQWDPQTLRQAATRLLPAPVMSTQQLDRYDAYYYGRAPEAMNGSAEKRLPVLRVKFGDASTTWVHLDMFSGAIESSMDRSQRVGRWLFNFLHSWDLPVILQAGLWREALLILLSAGGMVISVTGVVIGYRRMVIWFSQLRRRSAD